MTGQSSHPQALSDSYVFGCVCHNILYIHFNFMHIVIFFSVLFLTLLLHNKYRKHLVISKHKTFLQYVHLPCASHYFQKHQNQFKAPINPQFSWSLTGPIKVPPLLERYSFQNTGIKIIHFMFLPDWVCVWQVTWQKDLHAACWNTELITMHLLSFLSRDRLWNKCIRVVQNNNILRFLNYHALYTSQSVPVTQSTSRTLTKEYK